MKHRFVLISRWQMDCSLDAAWQRICAVSEWPQWWPAMRVVEAPACGGASPQPGDTVRLSLKTRLGYRVRVHITTLRALPPFELEGAADGDLQGKGLWLLESSPSEQEGALPRVTITYRWHVRLNRPWMRLLSPLLRPVFAWNHFDIMRAGARGMAHSLGCRLLDYRDYTFSPGTAAKARPLHWPGQLPT